MEGLMEGLDVKVIVGVIVGDDDTNKLSDGLDEDFIDGLDEENGIGSGGGGGALSKIPKQVSL